MKWTTENEEMLLSLYFEVKTRYEKKMKKEVEKFRWISDKFIKECIELTRKQVKDKIAAIKKLGNKKVREFVQPVVNRKEKTGAAVDEDESHDLDWEDINKKAKWPLLRYYFNLFNSHPTMGLALSGDSAETDESDAEGEGEGEAGEDVTAEDENPERSPVSPMTRSPLALADRARGASRFSSSEDEDEVALTPPPPPPPPPGPGPVQAQPLGMSQRAAGLKTPTNRLVSSRQLQNQQQDQFLSGFAQIVKTQTEQTQSLQANLQQQQQDFEEKMRTREQKSRQDLQDHHHKMQENMQQSMMTFQATLMANLFREPQPQPQPQLRDERPREDEGTEPQSKRRQENDDT